MMPSRKVWKCLLFYNCNAFSNVGESPPGKSSSPSPSQLGPKTECGLTPKLPFRIPFSHTNNVFNACLPVIGGGDPTGVDGFEGKLLFVCSAVEYICKTQNKWSKYHFNSKISIGIKDIIKQRYISYVSQAIIQVKWKLFSQITCSQPGTHYLNRANFIPSHFTTFKSNCPLVKSASV